MELLNEYSGLFSLIAAIASIVVPLAIYYKQSQDRKKELEDEYDAMKGVDTLPMSMDERKHYTRKGFLEKQLKK